MSCDPTFTSGSSVAVVARHDQDGSRRRAGAGRCTIRLASCRGHRPDLRVPIQLDGWIVVAGAWSSQDGTDFGWPGTALTARRTPASAATAMSALTFN